MGLFSKPIKTLDDLFVHTLQDIYYAENQIVKNLPTMIEKADSPQGLRMKSRLDFAQRSLAIRREA